MRGVTRGVLALAVLVVVGLPAWAWGQVTLTAVIPWDSVVEQCPVSTFSQAFTGAPFARAFYARAIHVFHGTWPVEHIDPADPVKLRRLDFNVLLTRQDGTLVWLSAPDKYHDPCCEDADVDPNTGLNASQTHFSFAPDAIRFAAGERLAMQIYCGPIDGRESRFHVLVWFDGCYEGDPECYQQPPQTAPANPTVIAIDKPARALDPPPQTSDPGEAIRIFVRRLYLTILLREPDDGGWTAHTTTIVRDCTSAQITTVVTTFYGSAEYQSHPHTTPEIVTSLYRAILGREPEPAGLASWSSRLGPAPSTAQIQDVAAQFVGSEEFQGGQLPALCP